jgi:hypothetical protein
MFVRAWVRSPQTACLFCCWYSLGSNGDVAHSVERSVRNRQAQGSKPCFSTLFIYRPGGKQKKQNKKKEATPTRFELARAEPSRFLIYLLNHSDTVSGSCILSKKDGVMRESNSRPPAPEAGIIPLDQSPFHVNKGWKDTAKKKRQRRDSNSRGQSPVDFESTSLTTRTRCRALLDIRG